MKKIFAYVLIFFLGVLLYLNYPKMGSAQWDDPRYDRVPDHVRTQSSFFSSESSVVTIDDYDNFDIGVDFAEVHVVENPRNPLAYLAAWNNLGSSIGARPYYTINGLDWLSVLPAWGTTVWGDPVLAYDSLGNGYFENMAGAGTITSTRVAKTTDNGQSWVSVVAANTGNDKNWIAADQTNGPYSNYIYTVMTPGNFKRSTDLGQTFVQTFNSSNSLPGNMVAVGPLGNVQGGAVYFVKGTGSAFNATWTFLRSTDGGTTFTEMSIQNFANTVGTQVGGRNSVQNMRTRPYPMIAADNSYGPYRGRLYLVYASNNPPGNGNKPDNFCRYSTDGGITWSSEVIINDDVNTTNNNQWMPAIWCDKETGKLYVQWMDTRDCPTSDSALIYGSYSIDGGVEFAPNQKISNRKFRINCTQCNGGTPAYLGDYNGITSNSRTSLAAWTDFRNNNFANYVAYFPDFAMRVNPQNISIDGSNQAFFRVIVPSVKLYTDKVRFTATVTPPPANGALTVSFPNRDSLNSYPDSLQVRVHAAPNTTSGNYTVTITGAGSNGTPVHRRTVLLTVGLVGVSGVTEIPDYFALSQNYPNPFNPVTRIDYSLKFRSNVKITVFDVVGRMIATINKGSQDAGKHFVNFNGSKLSSGVYYYKLETEQFTDTKMMLLIK